MKRPHLFKEELEIDQVSLLAQELEEKRRQSERERRQLELDREDQRCTLPPMTEIKVRMERRVQEERVSSGQVANLLRDQNHHVLLFVMTLGAAAALVWWGLRLMGRI